MKRTQRAIASSVLLAAAGVAATTAVSLRGVDRPPIVEGVVVDGDGAVIAGAEVTGPEGDQVRTDREGRFRLESGPGWVTVRPEGYVPRSRVAVPGDDTVIRVAPATDDTVSIAFGGDVMFGRRFFDPDEDGSVDGPLSPGSSAEQHEQLLSAIAPLLSGADIATVNLETPLVERPFFDPRAPRPVRFHPTKDYAFASAPAAAEALHDLGVDVVGLANNHLNDALGEGVTSTRSSLDAAGFAPGTGFFGAGEDVRQAWQPAYRQVREQRVAFVGCTSIRGEEHRLRYVASRDYAGAAPCDAERLTRAVRRADRAADAVVVAVHGGYEYDREPSAQIRQLSDLAVASGATLVVNHHPHVVGGLRSSGGQLTAWTLGNLLFDQTVWPTFDSYVLQVAVRDGRVVSSWVEPIRIKDFRPVPVVGDDAEWVARGALARSEGPWVTDDGSLWLDRRAAAREALLDTGPGLARIDSGCAPGAGREVLWTGDFESGDLTGARGALWNVEEPTAYRKVDEDAAQGGEVGVLMQRSSGNNSDVLLTVDHRVLVDEGDQLTFLMSDRARFGDPQGEIRLSWYNDTRGASQAQTVVEFRPDDTWRSRRVDVTVPRNAVAVQPYIALTPPDSGVDQLAIDNVALVDWTQPGCDYLRTPSTVRDAAVAPVEPDARAVPIEASPIPVSGPRRLPPGPPQALPVTEIEKR